MKLLLTALLCIAAAEAQTLREEISVSDSLQGADTGLVYFSGDTLQMGSSKVVYDTVFVDSTGVITTNLPLPENPSTPAESFLRETEPIASYVTPEDDEPGFWDSLLTSFVNGIFDSIFHTSDDESCDGGQTSADRSEHHSSLFGSSSSGESSSRPSRERGTQR